MTRQEQIDRNIEIQNGNVWSSRKHNGIVRCEITVGNAFTFGFWATVGASVAAIPIAIVFAVCTVAF